MYRPTLMIEGGHHQRNSHPLPPITNHRLTSEWVNGWFDIVNQSWEHRGLIENILLIGKCIYSTRIRHFNGQHNATGVLWPRYRARHDVWKWWKHFDKHIWTVHLAIGDLITLISWMSCWRALSEQDWIWYLSLIILLTKGLDYQYKSTC